MQDDAAYPGLIARNGNGSADEGGEFVFLRLFAQGEQQGGVELKGKVIEQVEFVAGQRKFRADHDINAGCGRCGHGSGMRFEVGLKRCGRIRTAHGELSCRKNGGGGRLGLCVHALGCDDGCEPELSQGGFGASNPFSSWCGAGLWACG